MSKRIIILILIVIAIIIGGIFIYQKLKEKPIVGEKKIYKIGVLQTPHSRYAYAGFKEKMKELGYEEGKNVSYEYFDTKGDLAAGKEKAEHFVQARMLI